MHETCKHRTFSLERGRSISGGLNLLAITSVDKIILYVGL